MIRDEQVHHLPGSARPCAPRPEPRGEDWPSTLAPIDAARRCAAEQFAALVSARAQRTDADAEAGFAGWFASANPKFDEELASTGFPAGEIAAVAASLESYRRSAAYRRLDEAGRRRLHTILGRLAKAAAARERPAALLERVLRILEAIGARSSYLALLIEQPAALTRLIEISAISGFLARQVAEFPLLLDELIDPKVFEELPSRAGFARELAARTEHLPADDPERQVEGIRQFQKAATFAVALADLSGRLPLMMVSDRLTDIAELIVQCCLDLAWQQITATQGVPHCGDSEANLRVVRGRRHRLRQARRARTRLRFGPRSRVPA